MAQKMRGGGLYTALKEGIQNTGPPPGKTFCSSDSSSSSADISSPGSLKKEVFSTLEAQKFLVYDRLDVEQNFRWELMAQSVDVIYSHGVGCDELQTEERWAHCKSFYLLIYFILFNTPRRLSDTTPHRRCTTLATGTRRM